MSSIISVDCNTSPIEALRMAYACGCSRRAAGAQLWDFTGELNEHVIRRYYGAPQARFLLAGFTAGYFNRPIPDVERIDAPYGPDRARARSGRSDCRHEHQRMPPP